MNTRRYHGLLTAALHPPVGRYVLLSKLEETLVVAERRFDLSVNQYPGVLHPTGHEFLREFRRDPYPTFLFSACGIDIRKSVFLVNGENTVVVDYELESKGLESCRLEIRPLIAFRDYHSTTHKNDALNPAVDFASGVASVQPYPGLPRLYLTHNAGRNRRDAAHSQAQSRRRSIHRAARGLQIGRSRISVVQRLGPRHDDCPARLDAGDGTIGRR
jgi:glycogen debranching enzyme